MADITIAQHIFKQTFTTNIGTVALATSTTFNTDFRLSAIYVNRSAGGGGPAAFTVTFDSSDGANFDALLTSFSISASSSGVFVPTYDIYFTKGDEIRLDYPTVGGVTSNLYTTIIAVQE